MEEKILNLINKTHRNIFLTGKAGTGKTTLLHKIIEKTHKNCVVVAPTGIAALNAHGVTIHSFFQFPFASFLPSFSVLPSAEKSRFENKTTIKKHFKINKRKLQLIENLELMIVDEVSMLRADLLDAMDYALQYFRKNNRPFGGVQMLFIGDLLQLPPVVKDEDWEELKNFYEGVFFFQSKVILENPLLYIELEKIYRQSDEKFISILNNLRANCLTINDLAFLENFVKPQFSSSDEYICLTTHNAKADAINNEALAKINKKEFLFEAEITGDFPEKIFPVEKTICLKEGARVMFVKNDLSKEKLFFNGKMGTITALKEDEIQVCLDGGKTIVVERFEWQNIRYKVNEQTKEIEEEALGSFVQFPIRLAWAITVHKSQGLTFEKAILDLNQVFASGQAYVAFSRLRSLDGLVLLNSVDLKGIDNSHAVTQYATQKATEPMLEKALEEGSFSFLKDHIFLCFDFDNLLKMWQLHQKEYAEKGERSHYKKWAEIQFEKLLNLEKIAEKFKKQLTYFFQTNVNFLTILHRFKQSYDYFFTELTKIWAEILAVQTTIEHKSKMQGFKSELIDLEYLTIQKLKDFSKIFQLISLFEKNIPFEKEQLDFSQIVTLRNKFISEAKETIKNTQLFENEALTNQEVKTEKAPKQPTHEISFELFKKGVSINDIAKERMLSVATIYRHLSKLIQEEKLQISDIFSEEILNELRLGFQKNENESLTIIYDFFSEKYSYDELRLFKNYLENKKDN